MVTLTGKQETIRFGADGFILHKLDTGAPTLTEDGGAKCRTVHIEGYIIPPGNTAQARREGLELRARRLRRMAAAGFTLTVDDRRAEIVCPTAPVFSCEPPFTRGEAGFFTVTGQTVTDGYFYGAEITQKAQGRIGGLAFPVDFIGGMIFGTLTREGEMLLDNTGDAAAGFVFTVTAVGGAITNLWLANEAGESIGVEYELPEGETLTVCTVTGKKDVTVGGESVLSGVVPDSEFFRLPTGESPLYWATFGAGFPAAAVSVLPAYI